MTISSSFGGLIYFNSPPDGGSLDVTMNNVIEAPFYDLTNQETVANWKNQGRNKPAIWAELAGQNIVFTVQSKHIRQLTDPKEVLKFWDRIVVEHHKLRGTNHKDFPRERVVTDIQPFLGYMHSGHPIVTHLDICNSGSSVFDINFLKTKGHWALYHEIGHNMQRPEWTFQGSSEVTVNIFSMHAFQKVNGVDITDQEWPRDKANGFASFFARKPTYESWKSKPGMALMTFFQLIKHFGWPKMNQFMSEYEQDRITKTNMPSSNQDKIDQWVIRYSKIVSRNIKPQFEMFGLPVSSKVDKVLKDLEPWCPTEEKDPNLFFKKLD
jgi:hypothetical protein